MDITHRCHKILTGSIGYCNKLLTHQHKQELEQEFEQELAFVKLTLSAMTQRMIERFILDAKAIIRNRGSEVNE